MDENGCVKGARVIKMELGEPDASGRRSPVEIPGSEYEIEADTVIMSLGTSPNPLISSTTKGLETNRRKCIVAEEENGATSKSGVFAGGDAVTGAATVILAMGAGKPCLFHVWTIRRVHVRHTGDNGRTFWCPLMAPLHRQYNSSQAGSKTCHAVPWEALAISATMEAVIRAMERNIHTKEVISFT